MTVEETAAPPGLRERKKQRTRREISDVATRLFVAHGFDAVTLAQIGEAAEVSVKTIFNHFGSKEDLYFDRAGELRAALVATVLERPAGTTALEALRRLMTDNVVPFPGHGWDGLDDPEGYERLRAFLAVQNGSAALRARRLMLGEELHGHLAGVLADDLGRERDDPSVFALTAMINSVNGLRDATLRASMAAGLAPAEVRRRVTRVVDDAYARLASAFADVDRAR